MRLNLYLLHQLVRYNNSVRTQECKYLRHYVDAEVVMHRHSNHSLNE